jgi:hypothetical protein
VEELMSLVHLVVTRVTGYDLFTLYFDDREENDVAGENPFSVLEAEFVDSAFSEQSHQDYDYQVSYNGYFMFPSISAEKIHDLYAARCQSKPSLERRYNIYFDQEHVHLEDMIKRFDRPIKRYGNVQARFKTYSHRLEYVERSIQILRDIQTAIYETEMDIAQTELELHRAYLATREK